MHHSSLATLLNILDIRHMVNLVILSRILKAILHILDEVCCLCMYIDLQSSMVYIVKCGDSIGSFHV